jgi:hypothetical protein
MKINYGSGSVTGSTSEDTVTMGGFTISNQVFCKSYGYTYRQSDYLLTYGLRNFM